MHDDRILNLANSNKIIITFSATTISILLVTATTNIIALSLRGVNLSPPSSIIKRCFQTRFWANSLTASSMIERCFRTRYLAAIAIESEFEEPNQDPYSPVQSRYGPTDLLITVIDLLSVKNESSLTTYFRTGQAPFFNSNESILLLHFLISIE